MRKHRQYIDVDEAKVKLNEEYVYVWIARDVDRWIHEISVRASYIKICIY